MSAASTPVVVVYSPFLQWTGEAAMLSANGGLKALLDGLDERGLAELGRLLAMRVES
jgi:hypothetical protein